MPGGQRRRILLVEHDLPGTGHRRGHRLHIVTRPQAEARARRHDEQGKVGRCLDRGAFEQAGVKGAAGRGIGDIKDGQIEVGHCFLHCLVEVI